MNELQAAWVKEEVFLAAVFGEPPDSIYQAAEEQEVRPRWDRQGLAIVAALVTEKQRRERLQLLADRSHLALEMLRSAQAKANMARLKLQQVLKMASSSGGGGPQRQAAEGCLSAEPAHAASAGSCVDQGLADDSSGSVRRGRRSLPMLWEAHASLVAASPSVPIKKEGREDSISVRRGGGRKGKPSSAGGSAGRPHHLLPGSRSGTRDLSTTSISELSAADEADEDAASCHTVLSLMIDASTRGGDLSQQLLLDGSRDHGLDGEEDGGVRIPGSVESSRGTAAPRAPGSADGWRRVHSNNRRHSAAALSPLGGGITSSGGGSAPMAAVARGEHVTLLNPAASEVARAGFAHASAAYKDWLAGSELSRAAAEAEEAPRIVPPAGEGTLTPLPTPVKGETPALGQVHQGLEFCQHLLSAVAAVSDDLDAAASSAYNKLDACSSAVTAGRSRLRLHQRRIILEASASALHEK